MDYCERFRGIAHTPHADGRGIIRLRCKQWSCEYCAKLNQSVWRGHLLKKMPPLCDYWTMITVTVGGEHHHDMQTLKVLMTNHDRLMKRLKREYGAFQYVRVYEQHKSLEFHMHILASIRIDANSEDWITDKQGRSVYVGYDSARIEYHIRECGLGRISDIRPLVTAEGDAANPVYAVRYVSKYLTKAVGATMPKGTRRIQTSAKIGSPKVKSNLEWEMKSGVYEDDVLQANWYDLNQRGRKIEIADFDNHYIYPPDS